MNRIEHQMLDILSCGYEKYGFCSIRAEFEAEGARRDEILRLVELGYKANLDLIIKIGGCEAIRDLHEAKQLGANTIIAPMVETPYALQKYIASIKKYFTQEDRQETEFYFNIETITAYQCQDDLVRLAEQAGLAGVVFGRVDFVSSLGLARAMVNSRDVTDMVIKTAHLCGANHQKFILGGGIDTDALPVINALKSIHLTRYETRKIAISPMGLSPSYQMEGLIKAAEFELLWLKNKQNYYHSLQQEDVRRIALLEQRVSTLLAA
jgi:hypothetical protein